MDCCARPSWDSSWSVCASATSRVGGTRPAAVSGPSVAGRGTRSTLAAAGAWPRCFSDSRPSKTPDPLSPAVPAAVLWGAADRTHRGYEPEPPVPHARVERWERAASRGQEASLPAARAPAIFPSRRDLPPTGRRGLLSPCTELLFTSVRGSVPHGHSGPPSLYYSRPCFPSLVALTTRVQPKRLPSRKQVHATTQATSEGGRAMTIAWATR